MHWLYIFFTLVGFLYLLSGIYEWKKSWRLNVGTYLPNLIGERKTRLLYIFIGACIIAIGITLFLQDLFSNSSIIFVISGILISITITSVFFRLYEGISIIKFLMNHPKN